MRPLDELNAPTHFEGGASFFDNGLRFAFDRSCDCGLAFRGIYEASRPDRTFPFTQVRKWDEFDELGIGKVGVAGISRDGLRAIVSCFNCPGGGGDWDLVYAERPDLNARFSFRDGEGKIQYLNINGSGPDIGASFTTDLRFIYFSSLRAGGQGETDIWRSGACDIPPEVSPKGSPYPLLVSADSAAVTLSFENLGDSYTNNLYIGRIGDFLNLACDYCHVKPLVDTNDSGRRSITFPLGSRNEFYLITASNVCNEGTAGFRSKRQ